jgi:hypothetical protein
MTTLAPPPGSTAPESDDDGYDNAEILLSEPIEVRKKAPVVDPVAQASWVFGVALAMVSEGADEGAVLAEVLAEAAGRSRAIEGAYGRAVALLSEFPGDPLVRRIVDILAKALLRSRRPAGVARDA